MPTYQKDLKRDKDGVFKRKVGRNASGDGERFRLGTDQVEAVRRLDLIVKLWDYVESRPVEVMPHCLPYWPADLLGVAKAIAKGKNPELPPDFRDRHEPERYVRKLDELSKLAPEFTPADPEVFAQGVGQIRAKIHTETAVISRGKGYIPTGVTFQDALKAYRDELHGEAVGADGMSLKPWGRKQLDQLKSWERYLREAFEVVDSKKVSLDLLGLDLAQLGFKEVQQSITTITRRPASFLSRKRHEKNPEVPETPLTVTSARHLMKVIRGFYDWLDLSDLPWHEVPKFNRLNWKLAELSDQEKIRNRDKWKNYVLEDEHIAMLAKYAQPLERCHLHLGLNCAFGPGEIGQLRVPFIKWGLGQIEGIRFKTGTETRHQLWDSTLELLRWAVAQRETLDKIDPAASDIVFLSGSGKPLWKRTAAGNYGNGVDAVWYRLIKRVRKEHRDFPSFSLGKLRKTAATRLLAIADPAEASMLLAHGTLSSEDKLLHLYAATPWKKLFKAQQKYGEEIAHLLKTGRPLAVPATRNHIGVEKAEKIHELLKQGVPKTRIADQLGISTMTIYRHLEREEKAKEKAGAE